jgi:hypothetical protein
MTKSVWAHTDVVFTTVRTSKRPKEGLEMIKRAADFCDTEAQLYYTKLTTLKANLRVETIYAFQKNKEGNSIAMIDYSIKLCFDYGTERGLIAAFYWSNKEVLNMV